MSVKPNREPAFPLQGPPEGAPDLKCDCGRDLAYTAVADAWTCPVAGFHDTKGHTWFLGDEDRDRYLTGWRP